MYSEPARRFLCTALAHDWLGLQGQAASSAPVEWALDAARGDTNAAPFSQRAERPASTRPSHSGQTRRQGLPQGSTITRPCMNG